MTTDTPESANTAAAFLQDLKLLPDVFRAGTINELNSTAQMLTRYAESLEREAKYREIIDEMWEIISQSKGVYGWRLNGEPASWAEFELPAMIEALTK